MALTKYKQKRDLKQTPEPSGGQPNKNEFPVFVVQKHLASHLHYDFRLEYKGILLSWAVPKGPSMDPKEKRLAMMVEDHPYDYRGFEGTIPEGNYGAGTVMVWDQGTYLALGSTTKTASEKEISAGLAKGHITFVLAGQKLNGEFALVRIKNSKEENSWLLIKADDDYASKSDITKNDLSAKTGRSMEEIANKSEAEGKVWGSKRKSSKAIPKSAQITPTKTINTPKFSEDKDTSTYLKQRGKDPIPRDAKPMLATLTEKPFDNPNWYFEIKWDGYRAMSQLNKNKIEIYSRNNILFNEQFKPIWEALKTVAYDCLLDGEIVVLDEKGKSQFQLLQNFQKTGEGNIAYYLFDLLWANGHDLQDKPLWLRKKILQALLPANPKLVFSEHVSNNGIAFFEAASEQELEGILAKDCNSKYLSGKRSQQWLKVKTHMRQEAVIGGFTEPRGSRKNIGALVLGVYEKNKTGLTYIGHTGGGFNEKSLQEIAQLLSKSKIKNSPFNSKFHTNAPVTWVKPEHVAEIAFRGWTGDGHMRQPIFLGLRKDKNPKEVNREKALPTQETTVISKTASNKNTKALADENSSGNPVPLSHLSKIFWPKEKYTKGNLIDYYKQISGYILPYLKDRPQSLNRHPNGIDKKSFFQKDVGNNMPEWIQTKSIHSEGEDRQINYMLCQDEASLIYMANLGCIEINPWSSTIKHLDNPDWLVIDLDPEDIDFKYVVQAALTTKKIFDNIGAKSFCKTSGATGLHIFVPLGAKYTYEQAKEFAHIIAILVNRALPKTTSLERSPKKRQGKVYIDYLQNRRGQTLAAPYSIRPRPHAPVSTPLKWEEVKASLKPEKFTMLNTFQRLKKVGDLWQPVLGPGIQLEKCLEKLPK